MGMIVEQYDYFEIELKSDVFLEEREAFAKEWYVLFESPSEKKKIRGFYDGEGVFRARFMPSYAETYRYCVMADFVSGQKSGTFCAVPARGDNHGPVRVTESGHFAYEDGTVYIPLGTTCYAWVHQPEKMRRQTVETLAKAPFNKIRMCVFPKHYIFNQIDPQLFPFERNLSGESEEWDYDRFVPEFFRNIERCLLKLRDLSVEADLILFHPYDKWGFAGMPAKVNTAYLRYVMARFGAFRNVWWSLANEYDYVKEKTIEDWENYGELLYREDVYGHLRSVHNGVPVYPADSQWVTHLSIQNQEVQKYSRMCREKIQQYHKPVIFDEVGYEGDICAIWGSLGAKTFLWRAYEVIMGGGYITHGETFTSSVEDLWWSHGGKLKGEAVPRLAFLKQLLLQTPGNGLRAIDMNWDDTAVCAEEDPDYMLFYYGMYCPVCRNFDQLEETADYHVEVIDTWNMTITDKGILHGRFSLFLPGKEWMLVRVRKIKN